MTASGLEKRNDDSSEAKRNAERSSTHVFSKRNRITVKLQ